MSITKLAQTIGSVSVDAVGQFFELALIILGITLLMEFFKALRLLEYLTRPLSPASKLLGFSKHGTLPWIIGLVFGLFYGAGLIIQTVREGELGKNETWLINVFLSVCHAVIEDTALFAQMGAFWVIILASRISVAFVITFIMARLAFSKVRQAKDLT